MRRLMFLRIILCIEKCITYCFYPVNTSHIRNRDQILKPLIDDGLLDMTIPDEPRSSKQKYRLTEKGKKLLNELQGENK